jgi:AcrR family transcriptional regulator
MAEIFNKKGFAGTTMADVEITTGVSRGEIYGNFENKEVMALAVLDHNLAILCAAIQKQLKKASGAYDKLMVDVQVYKQLAEDDFLLGGGSPILNTATEADDTNSLLKERVAGAAEYWQKCMVGLIEEGIQSGEFKPGININQVAFSIHSLIEGGLMLSRVTGDSSMPTLAHILLNLNIVIFICILMKVFPPQTELLSAIISVLLS